MHVLNALPSRLHSSVADGSPSVTVNDALDEALGFGGWAVITGVGGAAGRIVQAYVADALCVPFLLTARTSNVWEPAASVL